MKKTSIDYSAFNERRVLVTGHTGFKGSWLALWLNMIGAKVIGMALPPRTPMDNYVLSGLSGKLECEYFQDICDLDGVISILSQAKPEVVFHLAAQPLVLEGYASPVRTFETNLMGTVNILEACRLAPSVQTIVVITSDKCYENREWVWGYRESDTLGGDDPYSASKGAAEVICAAYRRSYFNPDEHSKHGKALSTARAGNVIGGGDWAEHRIIPDCIRSLENNQPIELRNPSAVRPWQHVLEPLGDIYS